MAMAAAGLSLTAVGAYIMTKPRRLFSYEDEPAEYRPRAVPIESAQARWLVRAAPAYVVVGLLLIVGAML